MNLPFVFSALAGLALASCSSRSYDTTPLQASADTLFVVQTKGGA